MDSLLSLDSIVTSANASTPCPRDQTRARVPVSCDAMVTNHTRSHSQPKVSPYPHALITPQHTLDEIPQGPPEVLASTGEPMLIDEQDIMFEACIEMRLKA
jgi:hypothetical protein